MLHELFLAKGYVKIISISNRHPLNVSHFVSHFLQVAIWIWSLIYCEIVTWHPEIWSATWHPGEILSETWHPEEIWSVISHPEI